MSSNKLPDIVQQILHKVITCRHRGSLNRNRISRDMTTWNRIALKLQTYYSLRRDFTGTHLRRYVAAKYCDLQGQSAMFQDLELDTNQDTNQDLVGANLAVPLWGAVFSLSNDSVAARK